MESSSAVPGADPKLDQGCTVSKGWDLAKVTKTMVLLARRKVCKDDTTMT